MSIAWGAARCDFDLAACGGVDEDEVPHRPAARILAPLLVRDLADHEHVPGTGHPGRDEVEDPGKRCEAGEARDLEVDVEVFLERLVDAQLEHRKALLDQARGEARRGRPECGRQVALRVDIDREHALAGADSEQRQRRGDRAPARATLARDKDRPPPKQRLEVDPLAGDRAPNRR